MPRKVLFVLPLLFLMLAAAPLVASDGAAAYKTRCAACHAADGSGDTTMGKKLALRPLGSDEVQKQNDVALTAIIAKGKGKMPGYSGKIDDETIAAVVKHIRSFAGK